MSSGDLIYDIDNMKVVEDESGPGSTSNSSKRVTKLFLNPPSTLIKYEVTVSYDAIEAPQETLFDTSKTYDIEIREH